MKGGIGMTEAVRMLTPAAGACTTCDGYRWFDDRGSPCSGQPFLFSESCADCNLGGLRRLWGQEPEDWPEGHPHREALKQERVAVEVAPKPELTLEERATNDQTREHIEVVRNLINMAVRELLRRGEIHDQSKLGDIERKTFVEFTPKLKGSVYGSDEYKGFLRDMKPALDNHYAHNRHHPDHFSDGIGGMNLIDVLEMLLDWKAATLRHGTGDIEASLAINKKRFGISDQLASILSNTVRDFDLVSYGASTTFLRGRADCYQDRCEGCDFASIGGEDKRFEMRAPDYVKPEDAEEYLRGYRAMAIGLYGDFTEPVAK